MKTLYLFERKDIAEHKKMLNLIYNIIILPIEILVDVVYTTIMRFLNSPGLSIIGVSFVISFLTLPLYLKADEIQEAERIKQQGMAHYVKHIRRTFKGDERIMMLSAYYREANYHPIYAVRSSLSLLLQIPFFIAAYHYLSNLEELNSMGFLFLPILSQPDRLFRIGSVAVNILPILMTVINIMSGAVYTKEKSLKSKLMLYVVAGIFLVLLYDSPSGLVLYWTMNNVFSLGKNIVIKYLPDPIDAFRCLPLFTGVIIFAYTCYTGRIGSEKKFVCGIVAMVLIALTVLLFLLKRRISVEGNIINKDQERVINKNSFFKLFILGNILLAITMGLFIPSFVVSAAPEDFMTVQDAIDPNKYILETFCVATGYFLVWFNFFYYLCSERVRRLAAFFSASLGITVLVNYMIFAKNFGFLSASLQFDEVPHFETPVKILNISVLVLVIGLFIYSYGKNSKLIFKLGVLVTLSTLIISIFNIYKTESLLRESEIASLSNAQNEDNEKSFEKIIPLSRSGKNVVVFMLDRAIDGYVPFIFQEKPELKKKFSGFTYYTNTLSFGLMTNWCTPALFGGYEYTPDNINKRDTETLASKHNEALSVLPVLFSKMNYKVTVCDPPYLGYGLVPPFSVYSDYPDIKGYMLGGKYKQYYYDDSPTKLQMIHNFFLYSVFRGAPLILQKFIYDNGDYLSSLGDTGLSTFWHNYSVLKSLPLITDIIDDDESTFMMIDNNTTHDPISLQLPDYLPLAHVDNRKYLDKTYRIGDITMNMSAQGHMAHFHANVASFMALGDWFDYMRKNDVYDNTRIIIVADHGRTLGQFDYMQLDNGLDVQGVNPLLMVKDFDSKDYTVSDEFMTNADVPTLALNGLIDKPVNPFTGREINMKPKKGEQIVTFSTNFYLMEGNTFDNSDSHWYGVHDNIFDPGNWRMVAE